VSLIRQLKSIIQVQSFHPTPFLGLLLNPFYFSRSTLDQAVKNAAGKMKGKILDVGCGSKPYRGYFPAGEYVGMEISSSVDRPEILADVFYSGEAFPFENQSFDHVVSFQVLEHVPQPEFFISEISRVLKVGGSILLTVPFVWEEHEVPHDRTRFTSYGLRELLERHHLKVLGLQKLSPGLKAISQLLTGMITVAVGKKSRWFRYLIQFGVVFPTHLLAVIFAPLLSKNQGFYLDNVVQAKRV
jgi:SAM-dependent methyltransferase